jgi:CheY-like chemotaxis protein
VDFAEFFTDHARRVVPVAWHKGLTFLFDYRGPFLDVQADPAFMQAALARLSDSALELLDDGFIFLTAQTDWNAQEGLADIAVSIGGTGQRASEQRITDCLQRLQLVEHPADTAAREGTRVADGICPLTGAAVSFAANRSDGILFAFDTALPARLLDVDPAPSAKGARAWLIGDKPGSCQSLVRRLQRLGWATSTFGSVEEASQQLRQMRPGMARPSLVIAAESAVTQADSLRPLREALPPSTQVVLATASRWAGHPRADGIERMVWPISPAELLESTHRLHGNNPAASGETMPTPLSFGDRPQALVVDDNAVNLMVASGLLQVAGFEVQTATGGEEAIARCRETVPELVLMDVHMPGMDGLETTRVLRRMQREGVLPYFVIVAATADAVVIGEAACRDAGMDGYLSKPLTLQAILAEVERLLPGLRRTLRTP